mmetsp:Transcript_64319/g.182436  ORF Transcript_64319/g.182436 Transcript_64319/m.182436 type:complete len:247 (+) Transcript_64319:131-871(+)
MTFLPHALRPLIPRDAVRRGGAEAAEEKLGQLARAAERPPKPQAGAERCARQRGLATAESSTLGSGSSRRAATLRRTACSRPAWAAWSCATHSRWSLSLAVVAAAAAARTSSTSGRSGTNTGTGAPGVLAALAPMARASRSASSTWTVRPLKASPSPASLKRPRRCTSSPFSFMIVSMVCGLSSNHPSWSAMRWLFLQDGHLTRTTPWWYARFEISLALRSSQTQQVNASAYASSLRVPGTAPCAS